MAHDAGQKARQHVLYVTGEYPPMTGGVGAYTERLANAIVVEGWRVSIVTNASLPDTGVPGAVSVYPVVNKWDWRIWRSIPRLAQEIDAQWIHVQYQTAAYGMNPCINLALNQWRRAGFRVAWTYHDLLVPYLFPKAGTRLRRAVTQRPASVADLTIVTNEGDRQQLDGAARALVSIPIGSNIQAPSHSSNESAIDERESTRRELGVADEDVVLAYFGFLNRSKGGITLIEALAVVRERLPNARLVLIGERVGASDPTNYNYLQEVEERIENLGLTDAVQWTDRLSDEGVSRMLNAIDVLVMPYEDGASLRRGTLMAGLAHGCAIVTTLPASPVPELQDGKNVVFVPPHDPGATAAAVLRLVDDQAFSERIRTGAAEASKQFSWEEIARRHARLYESHA